MPEDFLANYHQQKETLDQAAPEQEYQPEIAYVFERAIAFLVDSLLFFSVYLWSLYLLVRGGLWLPTTTQERLYALFFFVLFVLYSGFFSSGRRNTLGKALIGLKVVNKDSYEPLSFSKGVIRGFGYALGVITFFAGFALAFLNKKRRAVQDLVGGSVVISTREKGTTESIVISAFGTLLIAISIFYVYYVFKVMPASFNKVKVEAAQEQVNDVAFLQHAHREMFGYYTPDIIRLGLISGDPVQFQRDMQSNLRRRGFTIGLNNNGFIIKGIAKDPDNTQVEVEFYPPSN